MIRALDTLVDAVAICLAATLVGIMLTAWLLPEDSDTIAAAARVRAVAGCAMTAHPAYATPATVRRLQTLPLSPAEAHRLAEYRQALADWYAAPRCAVRWVRACCARDRLVGAVSSLERRAALVWLATHPETEASP